MFGKLSIDQLSEGERYHIQGWIRETPITLGNGEVIKGSMNKDQFMYGLSLLDQDFPVKKHEEAFTNLCTIYRTMDIIIFGWTWRANRVVLMLEDKTFITVDIDDGYISLIQGADGLRG